MLTDTVLQNPDAATITRKKFPVIGMTCSECAVSVESMLKSASGVIDAGVNFANQTAWAEFDDQETNPAELQKTIRSVGYDLIVDVENPSEVQEELRLEHYHESKQLVHEVKDDDTQVNRYFQITRDNRFVEVNAD